ncbi:MAG: RNA pseudouridine synthase, partial [Saprospiraceae bacterium]
RYLLEIDLHSGKFHQIRAQLQAIGSPIIGDKKYGSTRDFYKDTIALHACRLEVLEPLSGERLVFEAAFPYAM